MDTLNQSVNDVPHTVAAEVSATNDPFSGPIKNIEPWNFTILAVLMFVVTSLSLSENFLVMFVTFKYKQLRQPLNYIIVNLAIADFLVSLTGGVISFLTNARGYFFLGKWACVLEGFAVTFFGWNRYTVSKIGTTCEPDWYTTSMINHSYIITFFTTCFILPLGVIFFCYGKLLRKLRKVSHGRLANAKKPERQVTRMVVVMIVAFMVGWTPYAIFSILVTAHPTVELDPRLASIPAFFSKTAAVYNPIIYVFMNKQTRTDEAGGGEQVVRQSSATANRNVQQRIQDKDKRKCLIQLFTGMGTIPDSHLNQTSERPGITAESQTGEMSAIAARIPMGGSVSPSAPGLRQRQNLHAIIRPNDSSSYTSLLHTTSRQIVSVTATTSANRAVF
ncbi:Opsin-VA Vertebrate ancient opsin [Channa argus]|uniref:Opsin-VA Vertebrate ancient opsin n=1 Tax=Channa argus TaxID=215402 RepID=A0A6G1R0U6_CHAAH|nr:Opsin-VA Vertebrate ancient opsin [Channa argus]